METGVTGIHLEQEGTIQTTVLKTSQFSLNNRFEWILYKLSICVFSKTDYSLMNQTRKNDQKNEML